jgi:hydroxyacylglutathione hydrolase
VRIKQITSPYIDEKCHLVLGSDGTAVIVDPGVLTAGHVAAEVRLAGAQPLAVLLTHGHQDHTWDAGRVANYFGVPAYIAEPDLDWLARPETAAAPIAAHRARAMGVEPVIEIPGDLRPLPADPAGLSTLAFGRLRFDGRLLPGHTPGSTVFLVSEAPGEGDQAASSDAALLTGDVLFNNGIGRVDLPGGDQAAQVASLRTLANSYPDRVTVWPGHGAITELGVERRLNGFLKLALTSGKVM